MSALRRLRRAASALHPHSLVSVVAPTIVKAAQSLHPLVIVATTASIMLAAISVGGQFVSYGALRAQVNTNTGLITNALSSKADKVTMDTKASNDTVTGLKNQLDVIDNRTARIENILMKGHP